jgi:hypothetical protein
MKAIWSFSVLLTLTLAGCVAQDGTMAADGGSRPSAVQTPTGAVQDRSAHQSVAEKIATITQSQQSLRNFIQNTTLVSWDNSHGTQVEYLGPDGQIYLWYPGNRVVVPGKWKVATASQGTSVCFVYGPNTYNPVTKSMGGQWRCIPSGIYIFLTTAVVSGDVFRLSSGEIPFVISGRANLSLPELTAKAGLKGPHVNKATWAQ